MVKFIVIIFLVTPSAQLFSQNYFPVSNLNKYQVYEESSGWIEHQGSYSYSSYEKYSVIQDSIIEGKTFYNFSGWPFPSNCFLNYNQDDRMLFIKLPADDTIRLAVDFNIPSDSSFTSYILGYPLDFTSLGKSRSFLFGDSVWTYQIFHDSFDKWDYTFAENIGMLISHFFDAWGLGVDDSKSTLISAIIDSTIINPITLNINSLTPIIDRPLNSFPFILMGNYSTNINLVDTFFVELSHLRNNNLIRNWTAAFSSSGETSIYTTNLQAGDIIKLKAEIRDNSIFNNANYYPDTGYAVLNILPSTTDIKKDQLPFNFSLSQNYPNPFNLETIIKFSIPESGDISLTIYDLLGREVLIYNNRLFEGNHEFKFDASELGSGIYFYSLKFENEIQIKKMIVLK